MSKGNIKAQCIKPASELIRHMRSAFARGLPTLRDIPAHDGEAILCGAGPSLADFLPDIERHKAEGRLIVALKGTHDYLIDHGIIPHMAIAVDPQAKIADLYRRPNPAVRYFMSSQCHPDVFDALKDQHVVTWNVYTKSAERYWKARKDNKFPVSFVNGGSTTGLRCLTVAWVMGYRRLHLYGFDSCLRGTQLKVMGDQLQKEMVTSVVDHRPFHCDTAMALQGYEFMPQIDKTPDIRIKAYGDGLIPWIVDRSARRGYEFCLLPDEDWSGNSPLRGSLAKYTEADIEALNKKVCSMIACTTFADWAYDLYAKEFLETYVQHWKYPLHAYVDRVPDFHHPLITYHSAFSSTPELQAFLAVCKPSPNEYRKDAGRFAFKVFAQLAAIRLDPELIWLDADVVSFKEADHAWLEQTCNDYPLTLLARERGHSETGFVMFNAKYPVMGCMLGMYQALYTKKMIFELRGWTDCHALDYVRQGLRFHNLSPNGNGIDHVWPTTKLAEWCFHRKGIEKFDALSSTA